MSNGGSVVVFLWLFIKLIVRLFEWVIEVQSYYELRYVVQDCLS